MEIPSDDAMGDDGCPNFSSADAPKNVTLKGPSRLKDLNISTPGEMGESLPKELSVSIEKERNGSGVVPVVKSKNRISVDYPLENEVIFTPNYVFRISLPEGEGSVEVSVNESKWMLCRKVGENWWFDWKNYSSGHYGIVARLTGEGVLSVLSEKRNFSVRLYE